MTELIHEHTSCDGCGMIITTTSSYPRLTTTTRSLELTEGMDAGFIAICVVPALLFIGGILAVICINRRKHIIGSCCYYWWVPRTEKQQGALPHASPSQCSLPPPYEPPDAEDTGFRDRSYEMVTPLSKCHLAHQMHGQPERITGDLPHIGLDNAARNCTDRTPRRNGTVQGPRPGNYQKSGFNGELRQVLSDVRGGTTYYTPRDLIRCGDKNGVHQGRENGTGVINRAYVNDFNDDCPQNWTSRRHNTNAIHPNVTDSDRDARNSSNVSYATKPSKSKHKTPLKKKREKENEESYCRMDGHFHDLDSESDAVCTAIHPQVLPQFPILRKGIEEAHRRAESARKTLEQPSPIKCDDTAKTPENCGLNGSCDADRTTQAPVKVNIQKQQSAPLQFVVADEMLQQSLGNMPEQRAERKKCSNPNPLPQPSDTIPQNSNINSPNISGAPSKHSSDVIIPNNGSPQTSDALPKPKDCDVIPNDFSHIFPDPHLNPVVNPDPDYGP